MRISLIITILFLGAFTVNAQEKASKNQKASFEVSGVCGMCKKRIEKAALIPGVKFAEWNKETGVLSLIYNDRDIDLKDVQEAVAKAGHDTKEIKADSASYGSLPGCCAYRGGKVQKH
ncbi:heavy-metal-associated domain-containing protein [Luteibaculum oceani]|uniref:Heavy-metal-associated domain-containing protein n=1 Tax=Luteibaculum oceani TaxID=1294296 RepID=A0A5C6UV82_9FLAO|nr:heavy-metal-associated domain-containing protein [Luteibaculum oceani]TXC76066.1 heavy-metal-associated domain-containing protein [Luteibaculum oceani]